MNFAKIGKLFLTLGLGLFYLPLYAYQTDWDDPKISGEAKDAPSRPGNETPLLDSEFKIDGVIYTGYDFVTKSPSGAVNNEPGGDDSGFSVERVYLNVKGSVKSGPFKGWGFRFTPDLALASSLRNDVDCTSLGTCSKGNDDYVLYAKFAYIDMPLFSSEAGSTSLRLGLQPIPTVAPSSGVSMMGVWDHRYLGVQRANAPYGMYGLSSTADKGISLIHKHDYFGAHLLFANGEGYHKTNADGWTAPTNLTDLSAGKGNSYGYDLYGNVSLIPTGANKKTEIALNIPFRFQNIMGVESIEKERSFADFSNLDDPQFAMLYGDRRAKQDVSYGLELTEKMDLGDFEQTVGVGYVHTQDKRGKSILIDNAVADGINPADLQSVSDHWVEEEDRYGHGGYVFAHFKAGAFGGFVRYMTGVSKGTLSSGLGTTQSKPWLAQVINTDASDGILGNMTYLQMANVESSRARFHSTLLGITYHASPRYRISLGAYTLRGTDVAGNQVRENQLEQVEGLNGESDLATQLENSDQLKNALGLQTNDPLDLNDFIGKKSRIEEVFIRMQYIF